MELMKVKQLVAVLEQSTLTTLELTDQHGTLKLSKVGPVVATLPQTRPTLPEHGQASTSEQAALEQATPEQAAEVVASNKEALVEVTSPLVGTFYDKPSPDAQAFVHVGDRVEKGQVLCIIEAMKVMNEIKAPAAGVVETIDVLAGAMVEFGTPLVTLAKV